MARALVTGASRGIGAAIARRLAHDGLDVIVHYHQDRDGAEATAAIVRQARRQATVVQADLADAAALAALVEVARSADLTTLVNNAGIYERAVLADSAKDWRATMAIDLDAPATLCRDLAPILRRNGGAIVNISSIVAVRGSDHGAHYAAAKAGLLGLTRSLALELAPDVRVNAVCPGYVDTHILAGDSPEKRMAREAEVPLRRIGTPGDVAAAVSFLVGPDAAYVTGQTLHVNGGLWPGQ